MRLERDGCEIIKSGISVEEMAALAGVTFDTIAPGVRCLLDNVEVRNVAKKLRINLSETGILNKDSKAIQAIAFDKSQQTNWKVTWHQDVMFPFAQKTKATGYDLNATKKGVNYARPPVEVLESMLAVRLHLDDSDQSNGALRVSPSSHRNGIIPSSEILKNVGQFGQRVCAANQGDLLVMKPLTLHASSRAVSVKRRRVLHLVYYTGPDLIENWHRKV